MGSFALHYVVVSSRDYEGSDVEGCFASEPAAIYHAHRVPTARWGIDAIEIQTWEGPTMTDSKDIWRNGVWLDG